MRSTLGALAEQLGWELIGDSNDFDGVSIDTRQLAPRQLYVALEGDRFDGHDYVSEALAAGAAGALVGRPVEGASPLLVASDTRLALGALAAEHRSHWQGKLAAITGSAGKTTTKELLAAMLARRGPVSATRGNFNNEIGVPLTLMDLSSEVEFAVVEMGAAKLGDIAYLVALAKPDISIITNALPAHLQGFGDLATVSRTKGEIFCSSADCVSVINLDDAYGHYWRERAQGSRIVGYSTLGNPLAEVRSGAVELGPSSTLFELVTPAGQCSINLRVPGAHNVANALAAVGGALAAGLSLQEVKAGLEAFEGVGGRLHSRRGDGGLLVIDDTYNSNPEAALSALDVLALHKAPRVFVFGNMAELGADSEAHHRRVGSYARALGIEHLVAVGELAAASAAAFGPSARAFKQQSDLLDWLKQEPLAASFGTCLVKGSRSAHMENIVNYLLEGESASISVSGEHP